MSLALYAMSATIPEWTDASTRVLHSVSTPASERQDASARVLPLLLHLATQARFQGLAG